MENQPNAAGRQWFRPASVARIEQQPPPQPAQPSRGPPIRRASLALGRASLLPTTTTPPLQTEPTQNQLPAATIPQITKQSPPASPAPPSTLNTQPSSIATPSPIMAPKLSPPIQPQGPLAQELQQTAQTTTNGPNQSYVDVPKSPELSSPSQSRLRPIVTTRALTPESPTVIKTSLPIPHQSPRNGWPTGSPRHNPEPEPKSPPVAAQTKSNYFNDDSDRIGMKFNSNGEGMIHNSSESKLIAPQAEARKLHPSYNKEERHQTSSNGKNSIAKGSNNKKDEKDMRMITLAGNNLGAMMEVGSSLPHHNRIHQLQDQQNESGKDNKATGKIADAASYSKPMFSLTNSNVQCVNNSILYNASSIQRSPGVHITFNRHRQPKNTSSSVQGGHPPLH